MTAAPPRTLLLLSQTWSNGGIQRFNRTLLAASRQTGTRCDVLTLRDPEDSVPPASAPDGVAGTVAAFDNNRARFAVAAWRAMASGRYGIVVVGHINMLVMAVALTRAMLRAPRLLLIAHGTEVWTGIGGARRLALRQVQQILCVSGYTRDLIRRQAPELGDERFSLFPNALGDTWRSLAPTQIAIRRDGVRRYLLAVARLDRHDRTKGIITTIEALGMLREDSIDLVVAGRGDDLEFLRAVARRAGVESRVIFRGGVSDAELVELYRRCEAFVLPSGQEGFGIVFLEAMYFGAPVIAARSKGAVDVVSHEITGLLVDYGDVAGLRATIERMLEDAPLRARLAHAAHQQVTQDGEFTFDAFSRRWAAVVRANADRAAA